ncbi:tail fiber protein [Neisseria shayeganii]|uniref:Tail fiber protein n=2 Tax=Neisseria shayeganii TaxID=607712 RepID=A0A7D7SIN8_9NEIS|nr:tail fiber protein [Neisseria shayeganii]
MAAGAVPYTGAAKHVDLNGKKLNNAGELKLGDGRNNVYQQLIFGNYERSPGNGNYGAVSNSKFSGTLRWAAISNYGEDGQHISSLFADTAKAYVRIGSTNHELAKAADTILTQSGTFTGTVGYNRIISVNNGNDGMPDGAYKYGLGLSLASGNGKAQLYIAHTGGVYARGGYHTHPMQQWYRVDGADWADVRGRPTTLAGYGITDAASRTDVTQAAPPGTVMYFAGRNPPAGWLKANGAAVSRTTYAPLFAAIGTIYGSGDGSTTFNLPDVRGEFVRGWDDGRGVDAGRAIGSVQTDEIKRHVHKFISSDVTGSDALAVVRSDLFEQDDDVPDQLQHSDIIGDGSGWGDNGWAQPKLTSPYATGGTETRPRNVALLAIIKI